MRYEEEEEQVSETPKEIQRNEITDQVKSFLSGGGKVDEIPSGKSGLSEIRSPKGAQSGAMRKRIEKYDNDCAMLLQYIKENPGVRTSNLAERFGFIRSKISHFLSNHELSVEKKKVMVGKRVFYELYPRGNKNV